MVSKRVPQGEFETIWAIVNAVDRSTAHEDTFNKGRYLNRQEFMQTLVRCAIAVYVKRGAIGRMRARAVVQPLLVNTSALGLATECICMILKIDDLVLVR